MDPPTTTGKSKRPAAAAAAVDEVSDAEVEEFYAILRRHRHMREAYRRLVSSTGAGVGIGAPTRAPAWRPSFSMEDFAPPAPAPVAIPPLRQQQLLVAGNATPLRRPASISLDLNAEPEPQAPATPRPERDQA